jgi:hypothetical protein
MQMLAGAHAGGNGFQWFGYSIIDENWLAAKALMPYRTTTAAILTTTVAHWLATPGASGSEADRRNNLFGTRTCITNLPNDLDNCSVAGSYTPNPPLAGINVANSPFVVYSELNNNVSFTVELCRDKAQGNNVNHCVPLLLALHLGGDHASAKAIFAHLLLTWDGVGFGPPNDGPGKAFYTTRGLGYFLFAQRALDGMRGYPRVPAAVVAAMEDQLWRLQRCDGDGAGIADMYGSNGTPRCPPLNNAFPGHPIIGQQLTSIETCTLSLLPYDDRVQSVWFPRTL